MQHTTMDHKEPSEFDINIINIMTHMYQHNAIQDDVIEKMHSLNMMYHALRKKNELLESKVHVDWKTNLLKYREDFLVTIVKSASRILDILTNELYTISYIRFDIDDFSSVNNRYGHDRGDEVLVDIARILKDCSRPTDYVIRYGGEEFDVILPSTDYSGAATYLEKIYTSMEKLSYIFDNEKATVTMSAGLAIFSIPFSQLKQVSNEKLKQDYLKLQKTADDALYDAKFSGKNRYKLYDNKIDYDSIRHKYAAQVNK